MCFAQHFSSGKTVKKLSFNSIQEQHASFFILWDEPLHQIYRNCSTCTTRWGGFIWTQNYLLILVTNIIMPNLNNVSCNMDVILSVRLPLYILQIIDPSLISLYCQCIFQNLLWQMHVLHNLQAFPTLFHW